MTLDSAFQMNMFEEAQKRDRALDLLEQTKGNLIVIAKQIADELADKNGTTSGPEVMAVMKIRLKDNKEFQNSDPRFMGAVFRTSRWERAGHRSIGSHRQLVSIWRKK